MSSNRSSFVGSISKRTKDQIAQQKRRDKRGVIIDEICTILFGKEQFFTRGSKRDELGQLNAILNYVKFVHNDTSDRQGGVPEKVLEEVPHDEFQVTSGVTTRDQRSDQEFDECYADLGLPNGASWEEVKSVRRELTLRFHPDVGGETADADAFKRVQCAFERIAGHHAAT